MRYVSELYKNGESQSYIIRNDDPIEIVVHDTDTDKDATMSHLYASDVLGVVHLRSGDVLIRLSPQAVALYNHIEDVDLVVNRVTPDEACDICFWNKPFDKETIPVDCSDRMLIVNCKSAHVNVRGYMFSVIELVYISVYYFSLYDFLQRICQLTGVNIMQWKKVIIVDEHGGFSVSFKHDKAADRFFMKMWLMAG